MPAIVKHLSERRAMRRTGSTGKRIEYLALSLAGELYAVPIVSVAEIIKPPPITEVPRAPRDVRGVASVRGRLVTVVDLRRRFGVAEAPLDRRTRILLVDAGNEEQIGLVVDEVQQVWRLAPEEIEPAAVLGGEQQAAHITGIGRPGGPDGPVLVLLDLRPLLEPV